MEIRIKIENHILRKIQAFRFLLLCAYFAMRSDAINHACSGLGDEGIIHLQFAGTYGMEVVLVKS